MNKETTPIGELYHERSGFRVLIYEQGEKRLTYTASVLGIDFKNSKRDKLEQQINGQLDMIAALEWTPVLEAYTRYDTDHKTIAYLSVDRYWIVTLPAGETLRANWRETPDESTASLLQRCYIANLPPGFGTLPFLERTPERQRAWMRYTENAWSGFQRSITQLRQLAASVYETQEASRPTVFMPHRTSLYQLSTSQLEDLIQDYLDLTYGVMEGEHWSIGGIHLITVNMDGYDDADRSVIEQLRNGERCEYALEILMRVLVEKAVLPEGAYLLRVG
jgi:hypothetical protein